MSLSIYKCGLISFKKSRNSFDFDEFWQKYEKRIGYYARIISLILSKSLFVKLEPDGKAIPFSKRYSE